MLNMGLKQWFKMSTKSELAIQMRLKLLESAGEAFADKGFARATIREICERAGANVAAVNYYFRDKETLYLEAIKYWSEESRKKYPPDLDLVPPATAEEKLHAFIRSFLFRILDKSRPGWHGKLVAREMVEPTGVLDGLIETAYRPMSDRLRQIVRELGRDRLSDVEVRLCSRSILGQCLYYSHARPVISRLDPEDTFEPPDIERLADHITGFSVRAIREMAEEKEAVPK
jgi:TetR/AcrR family transcriptional regulator, regulator of cefoperazone and chloramphenicol sensitivity